MLLDTFPAPFHRSATLCPYEAFRCHSLLWLINSFLTPGKARQCFCSSANYIALNLSCRRIARQRVAPANQYAAKLFFSRSLLFTAYLWPVQAQHRYGNSLPTSLLLFAMPKQYPETPSYCSSLLRKSLPKLLHSLHSHRSVLLPWLLRIHIMHCLCDSAPCIALALPNNALLFFCHA